MNFDEFYIWVLSDLVSVEASEELLLSVVVRLTAVDKLQVSTVKALRVGVKFGLAVGLNLFETVGFQWRVRQESLAINY